MLLAKTSPTIMCDLASTLTDILADGILSGKDHMSCFQLLIMHQIILLGSNFSKVVCFQCAVLCFVEHDMHTKNMYIITIMIIYEFQCVDASWCVRP